MSKEISNINWTIIIYIISTILTVVGWLVLVNGLSSDSGGYIIMAVGILIALSTAAYLLRVSSKKRSACLVIGAILLIATLLILWDLYDEATNAYAGNFSAGNGFLLDGINVVFYVYAGPTLFIGGIILLIMHAMGRGKNQIKGR